MSFKSRSLNLVEPSGAVQACNEFDLKYWMKRAEMSKSANVPKHHCQLRCGWCSWYLYSRRSVLLPCMSTQLSALCLRSAQSHKFPGLLKSLDKRFLLTVVTPVPLSHWSALIISMFSSVSSLTMDYGQWIVQASSRGLHDRSTVCRRSGSGAARQSTENVAVCRRVWTHMCCRWWVGTCTESAGKTLNKNRIHTAPVYSGR
jgi:hypothetical protein